MVEYFTSKWKKSKKTKKQAKCNTFVTISKTLGKTHTLKPYKQGLPGRQGRNEVSPLKGIDTLMVRTNNLCHIFCRNEVSPLKGIDT